MKLHQLTKRITAAKLTPSLTPKSCKDLLVFLFFSLFFLDNKCLFLAGDKINGERSNGTECTETVLKTSPRFLSFFPFFFFFWHRAQTLCFAKKDLRIGFIQQEISSFLLMDSCSSKSVSCASMQDNYPVNFELMPCCGVPGTGFPCQ